EAQVRERGGYHVVHWSGHGHHDMLQIELDHDEPPENKRIGGADLVALIRRAGGFIPRLFFLSACHSGSLVAAKDWDTLRAALREAEGAGTREGGAAAPAVEVTIADKLGYTGTALELLRAKVPQVIAMRYEVGDAYARRLSRRFYRHLLADRAGFLVESALA